MKTDIELMNIINKVKEGNKDYFSKLYEESYKYLHTCVIHIVKNEDVAQDMLQEIYIEIYRNLAQLKDAEGFFGWASTIANRKCFAYLKKQKDVLVDELLDDEGNISDYFESIADDEAFIPENILDDQEKIKIIRGIIDELSDVQRACVIGFYYNEQKQDEIAAELGIPVNTVKSHLNRAKVKIKEAVGDTEKKQGIKLYSVAPFMLLLFAKEMDVFAAEAKVPDMSSSLSSAIFSTSTTASSGKAAVNATGMAFRTKMLVGILAVAVGVGAIIGTAKYISDSGQEKNQVVKTVENEGPAEQTTQEEQRETIEDTTTATGNFDHSDETDAQVMGAFGRKLNLDVKTTHIRAARNGLMIAEYEDRAVLMDYDGNILADNCAKSLFGGDTLSDFLGPTSEGYTVIVNVGANTNAYDKDGNVILETEGWPIAFDGKYLIVKNGTVCKYYNLEDGSVFYESEGWIDLECYLNDAGATQFVDGYSYLNVDGNLHRMNLNGELERMFPEKLTRGGIPIEELEDDVSAVNSTSLDTHLEGLVPVGAPQGGYLLVENAFDNAKYTLVNLDGNEKQEFDLADVMTQFANELGWEWNVENLYFDGVYPIRNNGRNYANRGKNIILRMTNQNTYVSAKCVYNIETQSFSEPVSNISTEGESYWTYSVWDDSWMTVEAGYMDYEGKKLASFEQASDFYAGRACVMKDGKAYIINEQFEIISEGIECDYMDSVGDICYLYTGEGESQTIQLYAFAQP